MPMRDKRRKIQVYLLDDHQFVRESLAYLISQEPDFAVCGEADNAARAEREILEKRPDLAVVDISLKESSGFDLIKTLHTRYPQLRIIVLSMHDEKLYAERCIRAGAHGYVMKRESSERIVNAIREVLSGKRFVSEQMAAVFVEKFMDGGVGSGDAILSKLSDRELEVFNLLGQGLASRKIAAALNLNLKTVQAYCARIKQKLHFSSATELLREATRWHHDSSNFE
jgi:DNA-binding NarL/FixJ family response regulator